MSVLNQQRVRVHLDREGRYPTAYPWETFCPCCDSCNNFATWADAVFSALLHAQYVHCPYCIDQQTPAGRDDLLGELFERCPQCLIPCEHCDGIAVYPANYDTPTELVEDLATVRLTPVFCDGCHGVLAVIPLDPEVHA